MNSTGRFASIPAFTMAANGEKSITRRQCTKEYKVDPVERAIRRQVLGLKPRQRIPKDVKVVQWFGLSYDEPSRVIRVREVVTKRGSGFRVPLFEKQMTRADCMTWLQSYPVPHIVPRSACVFCPYKSNSEWRRLRDEDPKGWARALETDVALRVPGSVVNRNLDAKLYVHRSCVPLGEVDLREYDQRVGQTTMSFDVECEGMCGS
jgi:hypothetical protein